MLDLRIHNKTKITVVVTLKNTGINHCRDIILPGGKHDFDLAPLNYDISMSREKMITLYKIHLVGHLGN